MWLTEENLEKPHKENDYNREKDNRYAQEKRR